LNSANQNYSENTGFLNFYDKKFFSIVRGEYVNLAKNLKKNFFLKISNKIWFLSNLRSLSSMVLSVLFQTISVTWHMAMTCPINVRDNNNEKLIWYLKSATQNYPKSIFRFNFYDKKFFTIVRGEYVNLAKNVKKVFFS